MPKTFKNLAQRSINYFLVTMPRFTAVKSESADKKEQENAYDFIKGIYEKLFDNPEHLGLKIPEDDCYPDWWTPKKEKPGLPEKIRANIKNVNLFIETIFNIVHTGKKDDSTEASGEKTSVSKENCILKPAMLKYLAVFGIGHEKVNENFIFTFPKGTLKGLKLLADISMEYSKSSSTEIHKKTITPFFLFLHGVFNPETPYTTEIFRGIFENKEAYDKLINYFEKNNFIRLDNKEHSGGMKCDKISFDFIKFFGKPEGKIGSCWKTRNFSGIEIAYDELTQSQTRIGIHLPFFKEILENADKMSES